MPVKPGHFEQRAQADLVRALRQHVEAELRDDAILADERHDVGERADRRNLDERRQQPLAIALAAQRLHELQRHADAREILVGIVAIVALRVDHRDRDRQLGIRLVVIRDDQIDAELARALRRLDAANAAVDRDDERHAVGLQAIERLGLQPVAVLDAVGKEVDDVGAEQLERAAKNDGRRDAVAVVVAMNGDALFPLDRRENPIDRRRHVREPERIVQMIERRAAEIAARSPARRFRESPAAARSRG